MKILVISTPVFTCPPAGYSGLEFLAWLIAKGLAERGHRVSLIAPEGSTCPGVEMICHGQPGRFSEDEAYNKYWMRLPEFEVVIDHSWQKKPSLLKMEGRLPRTAILAVCHAPVDTMFSSLPPEGVLHFVCISEDQGAHFRALFNRDCRVAHNGVDCEGFYKPLGIPRSGRFLFLARFSTIKGADLAIEACQKAGVGLDLIGDTSITNEPDHFNKCRAACDGKQIRMIGGVPRGECVWWYSQAHCLLHPNMRFREPFGLAPVEAMACGCPVIAWDNGAMRETVKHGETGWLVKSMKELVGVVGHVNRNDAEGSHINIMRNKCREQAKNFSVERMILRYESLCQEAVKKPW